MENKKKNIIVLIACLVIPVFVGVGSALLSGDSMNKFGELNQPPLSPPAWLFPIAWTILYLMMGLASYFILVAKPTEQEAIKSREMALIYYCIQLVFNFAWCLLFFRVGAYIVAFLWLVVMWALILLTMIKAFKVSKIATYLLVPYILWTTFAGYLNVMIEILN